MWVVIVDVVVIVVQRLNDVTRYTPHLACYRICTTLEYTATSESH